MSLEVRRVGATAATEVLGVIRTAFEARPTLDPPADALAETEESVAAELRAYGGLLAILDGEPVGALLFRPRDDVMVLRRFGVVPSAQGKGVAQRLVRGAVDATLGCSQLVVLAREELPATVGFWARRGFVQTDRRSPYVEMRRDLPTSPEARDADDMRALGERLGRSVHAGDVVVLTGELGAGKTTLTQGMGLGLGVRGGVTSPTFVIARVHPSLVGGPDPVHVDAYRLGGIAELDDLDLDTSLDDAVTVVEWGAGPVEGLAESGLEVTITRAIGDEAVDAELDPRVVHARRVRG
ncbi:tRNA (adenosine(37)-N6)-threonylcarbamoyltransferase complex ATPase subunit type 1 TsaE [Nocardioides sp. B-3]|uniref:tRNA (adenosine(37)-N6)-threonylcarbamoyltransferase complex ATPase subunit type 1 TsaE n=1 Tax=Nocardioides sp. B-3 TaxID=2895565 RepID=UPI0021531405|nr:tRNA (adenosine(37)-N6)-threonylcarbamoyltransferase complex ATPase subunit type 1 TsaE [Nocardioides sp. B-3]UUZ57909.1 tRNA (adenosine(37)-N6)-threonylcarbamoyltransferase complex ATPase subunit type 1 TsaE [Nocardioides sp. B-3]